MIDEKYIGTDRAIEVGDNVMYKGKVNKIIDVSYYDNCWNDYTMEDGRTVEYDVLEYLAGTPHKHRDLIIAWANGAEIEAMDYTNGKWYCCHNPTWCREDYRIKPSKSPKQLEKERIQKEMGKLAKDLEELEL